MKDIFLEMICSEISDKLKTKGFDYLKVNVRGSNIIIYSEYDGVKENRCRFSKIAQNIYILGMADHNGKWETTPFEGTIDELLELVETQFEWILSDYSFKC